MQTFEELAPACEATVNATTFKYQGKTYTISTTDITHLRPMQRIFDAHHGYTGNLGYYETMLFIDGESDRIYPFGDLPGHAGLGVFQRYDTEEEARDGHQIFVTRVQRILQSEGCRRASV